MAYNEQLAERIKGLLTDEPGLVEKKMFGGVAYLVNGNMACGVSGDSVIVRVGPEAYPDAVMRPGARPFDMTGRPMKGWVMVDPTDSDELAAWIGEGMTFARGLPAK